MKFIFRLQSLLNWKDSLEEESRLTLARENEQLRKKEQEVHQFLNQREANDFHLLKKLEMGLLAWDYSLHKQFAEEDYWTLVRMVSEKRTHEKKVGEERDRLTRLMREKKILKKLRENHFRSFLTQQERWEQKQLDEMALRNVPCLEGFSKNIEETS